MHVDPEDFNLLDLYETGWALYHDDLVGRIASEKEHEAHPNRTMREWLELALASFLSILDDTPDEVREKKLTHDLTVLGIGSIDNLRKMAAASGRTIVFPNEREQEVNTNAE